MGCELGRNSRAGCELTAPHKTDQLEGVAVADHDIIPAGIPDDLAVEFGDHPAGVRTELLYNVVQRRFPGKFLQLAVQGDGHACILDHIPRKCNIFSPEGPHLTFLTDSAIMPAMREYICPHCHNPIYDVDALSCHFCGESLNRSSAGFLGKLRYQNPRIVWYVLAGLVALSVLLLFVR